MSVRSCQFFRNYLSIDAFRVTQITVSVCDETSGKDCHIQPILMCERIADL